MNSQIQIVFLLSLFILTITAQSQKKFKKLHVYELEYSKENDTVKTLKTYYEYNDAGKETICKIYRANEVILMSKKEYLNDTLLISEHQGGKANCFENYPKIIKYSYDDSQRLTKTTTETLDGKITYTAEYWYNEAGNLLKQKRSNGLTSFHTYDALNNLTSTKNVRRNRNFYTIHYQYNDANQKVNFTKSNEVGWNNYYVYDKHGNKVEFLRFNQIGELSQKITYEYDVFNRVIKEHNFDESINEILFTHLYVYD